MSDKVLECPKCGAQSVRVEDEGVTCRTCGRRPYVDMSKQEKVSVFTLYGRRQGDRAEKGVDKP